LLHLAQCFAIELCAYAVMSNHVHLVLNVETELGESWSDAEVVTRWQQVYKPHPLVLKMMQDEPLADWEQEQAAHCLSLYRSRLQDISWLMRALNETIARQANQEDQCTGRFWEGRFKCQPLLDEAAVLSCMAYVDLNPVRAKVAKNLETSNHTSIQKRIQAAVQGKQPKELKPFKAVIKNDKALCITWQDYFALVDATGRIMREDKAGAIQSKEAKLLTKLGIAQKQWAKLTTSFEHMFKGAVGKPENLKAYAKAQGLKRSVGLGASQVFLEAS
jgi:REP element-mobilizing transposase RayT